ncbi:MAG: MoaD/ThiS family protein [Candidatus Bathyarchaeia archaeon]
MIKLRIRYFAPFDNITGKTGEFLEVEKSSLTVSELVTIFEAKYNRIKKYTSIENDEALRGNMIIAVGKKIAYLDDHVYDGDQVKILPPIVGG